MIIEQRYTPSGKKLVGSASARSYQFKQMVNLGLTLGIRNIKSKYRQTIFGLLWAFLPPLTTAVVWIFLTGSGIVNMKETEVPYPVYVIFGTTIWQLFVQALNIPLNAVQNNRSILVKINFPRQAVLIAGLVELFIPILAAFIIMIVAMAWFGILPGVTILAGIVMLIVFVLLGFALGLYVLPVGILYKDVQYALPIAMQFLMYLTPVLYPKVAFDGLARILEYNPFTPIVVVTRGWLLDMNVPYGFEWMAIYMGGFAVLLWMGLRVFRISLDVLIERMGS